MPHQAHGTPVVTSEPNIGEGQIRKKAKRDILRSAFFTVNHDTRCFPRVSAGAGIADRKAGYGE